MNGLRLRRPGLRVVVCAAAVLLVVASAAAERTTDRTEIRRLLASAQQATEQGDTAAAMASLDSVFVADPRNPDAPYRLGILHLASGDTASAVTSFEEGVAVAPMSRRLKLTLAFLYTIQGDERAAGLVDEVLMLRRNDVDALYLRGLMALAEGDSVTALETWDGVLAAKIQGSRP